MSKRARHAYDRALGVIDKLEAENTRLRQQLAVQTEAATTSFATVGRAIDSERAAKVEVARLRSLVTPRPASEPPEENVLVLGWEGRWWEIVRWSEGRWVGSDSIIHWVPLPPPPEDLLDGEEAMRRAATEERVPFAEVVADLGLDEESDGGR